VGIRCGGGVHDPHRASVSKKPFKRCCERAKEVHEDSGHRPTLHHARAVIVKQISMPAFPGGSVVRLNFIEPAARLQSRFRAPRFLGHCLRAIAGVLALMSPILASLVAVFHVVPHSMHHAHSAHHGSHHRRHSEYRHSRIGMDGSAQGQSQHAAGNPKFRCLFHGFLLVFGFQKVLFEIT
jgi:hypothetical protein